MAEKTETDAQIAYMREHTRKQEDQAVAERERRVIVAYIRLAAARSHAVGLDSAMSATLNGVANDIEKGKHLHNG